MSVQAHIQTLQSKHAQLEAVLAEEAARPLPDFMRLANIKKQKLVIKQELQELLDYSPVSQAS